MLVLLFDVATANLMCSEIAVSVHIAVSSMQVGGDTCIPDIPSVLITSGDLDYTYIRSIYTYIASRENKVDISYLKISRGSSILTF